MTSSSTQSINSVRNSWRYYRGKACTHTSIIEAIGNTPLVQLRKLFPEYHVVAKLELMNPGGSVKDRPAKYIIERGLKEKTFHPETHLLESTSGNLGIALAMVAKGYGLKFTAVVDPKITPANSQMLRHYGANVETVYERDEQGGYLNTRIQRVQELLKLIPHSHWINQYANPFNWQAHYFGTAKEIISQLDQPIDCLVLAVGTGGTLMGISRRLRKKFPRLHIVAVDAVGSVTFGGKPAPREIPGIGTSRVPELMSPVEINQVGIDQVIYVSDRESVRGCYDLLEYEGIFAGGSSGSVIAAIHKLLPTFPPGYRILTLFPDRGDRYLDLVYNDAWVAKLPNSDTSQAA
jgi:cysteine synthase A